MKFIFKVYPRLEVSRLIYKILQDHQHFPFYPLSSCTNRCLQIAENGHFIWSFPFREIHVYGCLNELQNDKVGLTPWASIKYLIVSSGSQFMLLMTKTLFATHRSDCISMRKLETSVE